MCSCDTCGGVKVSAQYLLLTKLGRRQWSLPLYLLAYREAVVAEQVAVDEEELEELQRPWHAAYVHVGLVKEPLEGRLGAWTKDA